MLLRFVLLRPMHEPDPESGAVVHPSTYRAQLPGRTLVGRGYSQRQRRRLCVLDLAIAAQDERGRIEIAMTGDVDMDGGAPRLLWGLELHACRADDCAWCQHVVRRADVNAKTYPSGSSR